MESDPNFYKDALDKLSYTYKIPKDYLERLANLRVTGSFMPADIINVLNKMNELEEERTTLTYIFYIKKELIPIGVKDTETEFHIYLPNGVMNEEAITGFRALHEGMGSIIFTPCEIEVKLYNPMPRGLTMSGKVAAELELVHNIGNPNWDKLGKRYVELLQSILVNDPALVYKVCIEKCFSSIPRIECKVTFFKKYDCAYNKRTIEKRKTFQTDERVRNDIESIL